MSNVSELEKMPPKKQNVNYFASSFFFLFFFLFEVLVQKNPNCQNPEIFFICLHFTFCCFLAIGPTYSTMTTKSNSTTRKLRYYHEKENSKN